MTDKVCATYPDACAAVESPRKIYVTACPGSNNNNIKTACSINVSILLEGKRTFEAGRYSVFSAHQNGCKQMEDKTLMDRNPLLNSLEYYKNIRSPKDDVVVLYACYTIHTESVFLMQSLIWYSPKQYPKSLNLHVKDPNFQLSIHHIKKCSESLLVRIQPLKGKQKLVPPKKGKTVKHLLPPPYETKCKNYITEWEARGGNGPTTEKVSVR
ncbi:uncharacterized protein CEXT_141701 [Caerostris extrusa]|uniref:Uncharacterized protein n=1 Tax=Caerostris extrusa TaxID=172846 RepID=A0AAV4SU10_CAEEX|nr:uncharacterized protein CEXT_141701 [Caerostris extrusa]